VNSIWSGLTRPGQPPAAGLQQNHHKGLFSATAPFRVVLNQTHVDPAQFRMALLEWDWLYSKLHKGPALIICQSPLTNTITMPDGVEGIAQVNIERLRVGAGNQDVHTTTALHSGYTARRRAVIDINKKPRQL